MPYPPRPQRKWPGLSVAEARTRHLEKYQFRRGEPQPDNPRGMTKAQREQYQEAKELLHQAGPLAIRRLVRLAGIDVEAGALVPDDELGDPRVALIAAQNLAERVYGKPREMPEPVAGDPARAEAPRNVSLNVRFVSAAPQPVEPTGPIIDTTAAPGPSEDVAKRTSGAVGLEVTPSGAWRKVAPPCAEKAQVAEVVSAAAPPDQPPGAPLHPNAEEISALEEQLALCEAELLAARREAG